MNEELEFLWWHMRGDFGWLMAFAAWSFALRMVFKPISKFFESYISQASETESRWAKAILGSVVWRFINFTLDYLASVKLPALRKKGETQIIKKEP